MNDAPLRAEPIPAATSRRHDLIAIAILAALATLLFADVLAGVANFYMRDLTRYYYPSKQILREIALNGEFPQWNRFFHAGQPMAANPEHEAFYPLTWLILLPSYDLGYRLQILVHVYIGLLGMYAMLRSMQLRATASFFGALAFGLGGIYLSYINLLPILYCAAWLPLTCLYVRRFMFRPGIRAYALASLFLGLQFLVGEPTTVMQTGFLIGMYAMYRGWYAAREYGGRWRDTIAEMLARVAFIALISLAAIAVGAAQMMPAIDHVGDSARSRIFDFSLVSAWSFPWAKIAELIYPNILGHISIDRIMWYWGGGLYPGMGSPFLFNIYSGLLVTALFVAGLFVRVRGSRFVLILVGASLAIALGSHTPFLRLLYEAGIATSIRYPEKFILIGVFAIIVFSAQMLDRMLNGDAAIRDAAVGFALATAIVAAAFALLALLPVYASTFTEVWGLKAGRAASRMVELSREGWIIATVRGVVLSFLLWTVYLFRRSVWIAALLLFVALDLGPVMHQLNPRMPAKFFTQAPPAASQFPRNREPFRVFHEVDWYGQEDPARRYFSTGSAVYWIVRNGLYPMTPVGHGLRTVLERDYDKTALLPTIDLNDSVWDLKRSGYPDWWKPFVAMSNAWYRAEYVPFDQEKKRVRGNFIAAQPVKFTELEHHPRYYFAEEMVPIVNRHDFVKKLKTGAHSLRAAFVETGAFAPASGVVHGYRETANTAAIDVESSGRGFLVMSVTPHKYWKITLDGRPVQAIVTNIGYQGIIVPAGSHRVDMRYSNPLILIGSAISIVAAFLLAALALVRPRRARA
ncbi:MAG: hypothetical protein WA208_00090 [Thermoanaerobaculia bacterium]